MRIMRFLSEMGITGLGLAALAAAIVAGVIAIDPNATPVAGYGWFEWLIAAAATFGATAVLPMVCRRLCSLIETSSVAKIGRAKKTAAAGGLATTAGAAGPTAAVANGAVAVPKGLTSAPKHVPMHSRDLEFLPAALEILVAPPSPVAMGMIASIATITVCALAWSYFGWLDIYAIANGKILPSGGSKIVQPLEPGKVTRINTENGARVAAGDALLELDGTETAADRETQVRDAESVRAELARRNAAMVSAETGDFTQRAIAFDASIGEATRRREGAAFIADMAQLKSNIGGIEAQIAEKAATKKRLAASIEARSQLLALARERLEMRKEMDARGAGSRALVLETQQQLEMQLTTDAGERGQVWETDAAVVSLEKKREQIVTQFTAEQAQKIVDAERRLDKIEQDLLKAKARNERTVMRAPIAGTVQQLAVTTIGQVVSSGQALMTIVPADGAIEVEALIANQDIGFVKLNQHAVVKVEAFPFSRYGVIDAEVSKVSNDAVDDRDGSAMGDAASAGGPARSTPTRSSRAQTLVFPATLKLARRSISVDGSDVPLSPGMAVTVEIKTGERRVIDYVLSPIRETISQSAHER